MAELHAYIIVWVTVLLANAHTDAYNDLRKEYHKSQTGNRNEPEHFTLDPVNKDLKPIGCIHLYKLSSNTTPAVFDTPFKQPKSESEIWPSKIHSLAGREKNLNQLTEELEQIGFVRLTMCRIL